MNIPDNILCSAALALSHVIWLAILLLAVWRAPWRRFSAARVQHVYLGAIVMLLLLWSLGVTLAPGLGFHFLGVTVFTLMFGWSLAVIGVGLVAMGMVLQAGGGWETLAANALLLGVLPVSISYGIYYLVRLYLPHHLFIYIFLSAFFSAIFSTAIVVLVLVGILVMAQTYSASRIAQEYLPFLPLYLLPEGVLNGMVTTIFIGMRPQWLKTFDDESYLR